MTRTILSGALGAAACLLASPAFAHVTFETAEARPNAVYKGVLRVTHGCGGAATHTVRVAIPEGVVGVQPQPKPGWTLSTVKGPYAKPFDDHGAAVTEGVREIVWSGGRLLDEHYDEFVFRGRFVEPLKVGDTAYFPVVQDCEGGSERWVELPAAGRSAGDLKHPAPGVRITPAATGGTAAAAAPPTGSFRLGSLLIEAPWSRATPGGAKVAGGYLRITNRGAEPDRLLGGSAAVAGRFEIHEMSNVDGVMRMRPVEGGLAIPPGATVELKPGGFHAMLMDLRQPLKEGDVVGGTLVFERAGTVAIGYRVGGIGAKDAGTGDAHH